MLFRSVAMVAWERAGDASYDAAGEPWTPAKLYYLHTFTRSRTVALHNALISAGLESPYDEWLDGWREEDDNFHRVTTRVTCADYFDARDNALRAHATQIDPDGAWFAVPRDLHVDIWPTEDFELAASRIGGSGPEDDLFTGLRTT